MAHEKAEDRQEEQQGNYAEEGVGEETSDGTSDVASESQEDEASCDSGGTQDEDGVEALAATRGDGDCGHNKDLGKRGEDAAAAFLARRGYDVLERNWTCIAGEVDIIAQDQEAIHFVEVKTRMSEKCGFPSEAVTAAKRKRYERIAEIFLCDHESEDTAVMFDIVSILVTGEHRAFLKMHRNAFCCDC